MFSSLLAKIPGVHNLAVHYDDLPNGSTNYYPGDNITGRVTFTVVKTAVPFKYISVTLSGFAIAEGRITVSIICNDRSWLHLPPQYQEGEGGGAPPPIPTNLDGKLLEKEIKPGFLSPGDYCFPFTFSIPINAPSSNCSGRMLKRNAPKIMYRISARICRVGRLDNTAGKQFDVSRVVSEEQYSMEKFRETEFSATLPMKSVFGSNGVVEAKVKLTGIMLRRSAKVGVAPEGLSVSVDVNACGKKPVTGVTVELQEVTQVDHFQNEFTISSFQPYMLDREGDLRPAQSKHKGNDSHPLAPTTQACKETPEQIDMNRTEEVHSAMGTSSNGYVVQGTGGVFSPHSFVEVNGKTSLSLENGTNPSSTRLSVGERSTYSGVVYLAGNDVCLPTTRLDRIQINYRLLIEIKGCSKAICLPIVVVDDVISTQQQQEENFRVPWFHHEKISTALRHCRAWKREVAQPPPPFPNGLIPTDSVVAAIAHATPAVDTPIPEGENPHPYIPSYDPPSYNTATSWKAEYLQDTTLGEVVDVDGSSYHQHDGYTTPVHAS